VWKKIWNKIKTNYEFMFNINSNMIEESKKYKKNERPRQISKGNYNYDNLQAIERAWEQTFKDALKPIEKSGVKFAMDNVPNIKSNFYPNNVINETQVLWYASQSFIGYQFCSMLAQNWLISKCCLMPARDAIRNGYEITVNDGTDVESDIIDDIKKTDIKFKLNKNLREFIQLGRIFGIRIALFNVETDDPIEYYKNPFNPDSIKPGSYKGISQIDPYWITPQLDTEAAGNPASINFYEPTWWNISGRLVHHTHLMIFRTEEVSDILKPTYIFGGISIPQKIYYRVYAAEQTANEAPMLAATKRMDVLKTDAAQSLANEELFTQRMQEFTALKNNFGIKIIDREDDMMEFDTSLADLDAVIMTQYQLVAAAANVPSVKLLGTPPKGFNSTGEFEEANYHEELESIQEHDLTPLIERHHLLLIRSYICPKYGIEPFETTVKWHELDAMTTKEMAELNKIKAETGNLLMQVGSIDGQDERQRIVNDPHSGYTGLDMNKEIEIQGIETEGEDN
jgi:uncharacterized protein